MMGVKKDVDSKHHAKACDALHHILKAVEASDSGKKGTPRKTSELHFPDPAVKKKSRNFTSPESRVYPLSFLGFPLVGSGETPCCQ